MINETTKRHRLWAELAIGFFLLPAVVACLPHAEIIVVPIVFAATAVCYIHLRKRDDFDIRTLWDFKDFGRHFLGTLLIFIPLAAIFSLAAYALRPDLFSAFPTKKPLLWLVLILGYPPFSAWPQELIYRAFFFRRYSSLFPGKYALVLANTVAFGWVHIFMGSWIVPFVAAVGGLLFTRTYFRTGGILHAAIEHGLWGNLLFTTGVGWYYYTSGCAL